MNRTFGVLLIITILMAIVVFGLPSVSAPPDLSGFVYGGSVSAQDDERAPSFLFDVEGWSVLTSSDSQDVFLVGNLQSRTLTLRLIVNVDSGSGVFVNLHHVSYRASWRERPVTLYRWSSNVPGDLVDAGGVSFFSYDLVLRDVPEGYHQIDFSAIGGGLYVDYVGSTYYSFTKEGSASFVFTAEVAPAVSFVSPENQTYRSNGVPLVFEVDKDYSWLGYSLNGRANVTIPGNTTLTGLSDGSYSLVVYANGTLGSMGKSDVVFFTVETSDSLTVVAAYATVIIFVFLGLVAYVTSYRENKLKNSENGF